MRDAVYNGCYNAFLDIWQRYGEEISDGRDVKVYLDGKQLTASVEKRRKNVACLLWVPKFIPIKKGWFRWPIFLHWLR